MTEKNKRALIGASYSVIGGLIVAITMFFVYSFSADKESIQQEIIRLDKEKANIEYVNQCIVKTEQRVNQKNQSIDKKIDQLNAKTDKILELMIQQK